MLLNHIIQIPERKLTVHRMLSHQQKIQFIRKITIIIIYKLVKEKSLKTQHNQYVCVFVCVNEL